MGRKHLRQGRFRHVVHFNTNSKWQMVLLTLGWTPEYLRLCSIWTLWQRALSTISFVTVAIVHTALITCILPNLSHPVPWGWEHVAMTFNYLLLNLNSINKTLLSVLYFTTYDCVYTVLVLSGCVVTLKIFHWGLLYDFSVMCILFMYCSL